MKGATRDLPRLPFQGTTPVSVQCSHAGAVEARERSKTQIWAYLKYLQECGSDGSTDHEAAQALDLPLATICARRNFWVTKQIVRASGQTRPGPTGTKNTVWVIA